MKKSERGRSRRQVTPCGPMKKSGIPCRFDSISFSLVRFDSVLCRALDGAECFVVAGSLKDGPALVT